MAGIIRGAGYPRRGSSAGRGSAGPRGGAAAWAGPWEGAASGGGHGGRALLSCPASVFSIRARRRVVSPDVPARRPGRVRRLCGLAVGGATVVSAIGLGLLPARPVLAGWTRLGDLPGLGSGRIWQIAFTAWPTTAAAATDNGVYITEDGGQHWRQAGLRGERVWTVGFDARGQHPMFAGTDGSGVMRSDDGGRTWVPASTGLVDRHVRSLAFGLGGLVAGTNDGVAVSVDGQTWTPVGLRGYSISAVAVSANSPTFTIIAGADNGPGLPNDGYLFRNAGPGPQWETLQQGLPALQVGHGPKTVVSAIAAGPLPQTASSRPLVLCTNKGTFHSVDGGTSWAQSTLPNPDPTRPVQTTLTTATFSPLDPNLVYAGADAGGSTGGTLVRSTDGGATFAAADQGLSAPEHAVESIAVAPAAPPLVLVAVDPVPGTAAIVGQVDTTAPAPAPTQAEAAVTPAPPPPTPPPTARPRPTPVAPPPVAHPPPAWRRVADRALTWPLPLAAEILVVVAVVYGIVRWRQRKFDVEGPP